MTKELRKERIRNGLLFYLLFIIMILVYFFKHQLSPDEWQIPVGAFICFCTAFYFILPVAIDDRGTKIF